MVLFCSHNDLPYELREKFSNQLDEVDLMKNSSGEHGNGWQTDIPRLRAGQVGAQVCNCPIVSTK